MFVEGIIDGSDKVLIAAIHDVCKNVSVDPSIKFLFTLFLLCV